LDGLDREWQWADFVGDLKSEGLRQDPYFTAVLFQFSGRFGPGWVNFDRFCSRFFPFLSFFPLPNTVYSQTETDPVL
jgi:hypothetical protein